MDSPALSAFLLAALLAASPAAANAPDPTDTGDLERDDAVVVTASRSAQRARQGVVATEVIDRTQVRSLQARDAAAILEGSAGLRLTRTQRGAGVSLQGLDGKHVLILVDGERLAGRRGEELDLSRFLAVDIERIEIVRGAASSLYGSDAIGGVINIITRRPDGLRAEGEARLGTIGQRSLGARASIGSKTDGLSVGTTWDAQGQWRLDPASPGTDGSAFDRLASHLAAVSRPHDSLKLDARLEHTFIHGRGVDAIALPPGLDGEPRFRLTDRETLRHILNARLAPTWSLGAHKLALSLSTSVSFETLAQQRRAAGSERTEDDSVEGLVNLNARWTAALDEAHLLTVGVDSFIDYLDSERIDPQRTSRGRVGLYAQHEWRLDEDLNLSLVPGGRLDLDTLFGAVLTPRLAARVDPIPELALRGSAGLGFRAPGFRELFFEFDNPGVGYRVAGNPDLRPERSRSVQLGLTLSPSSALSVSLEAFIHRIDDFIITDRLPIVTGQPELFSYVNVGRALSRGLESRLDLTLVEALKLRAQYAFIDATDLDSGERLPNRAPHNVDLQLSWNPDDLPLSAELRLSLLGARPFDAQQADGTFRRETSGWDALMSARLSAQLTDQLHLYVAADNLLDAYHPEYLPIRPRSIWAGLEVNLGGGDPPPPDPQGAP